MEVIYAISELQKEVFEKIGKPVNVYVVRATLESMGIRNQDAQQDYGKSDLQNLAQETFEILTSKNFLNLNQDPINVNEQFKDEAYSQSDYFRLKAKYFLKFFPLGIFHGLPVFLQIATIIVFGYSLWTWVGFNQLQSTAVVLGVIFGLIGTGGFVSVIGRQVSHYWFNQDFRMAKASVISVIRDGLLFMLALSVLLLIIDSFINFYPYKFLFIVYAYSFSIGILLMLSAVFHPIKERWVITLAFIFAGSLALFLKFYTSIDTYYTHWIGIWSAIVIMFTYLYFFFRKRIKNTIKYQRATTKREAMVYRNYKHFFYGLVFFVFIFIDRVVAWSTSNGGFQPYVIYYEKSYEIGMDIAILVFFLLVGVLEFSVASFSTLSDKLQKQISFNHVDVFNKSLLKTYWQHVIILFTMGLITTLFLYAIIWELLGYERAFDEALDLISIKVSLIGGLGYIFIAWGMLNSLYLFTLNKPSKPLNAIIIATVVNLLVGMAFSRLLSYEYSVIGMLAGSVTYAILTLRATLKFFKKLDYYYYAAY